MKMMRWTALFALVVAPALQAFELAVDVDSEVMSRGDVIAMVNRVAGAVDHRVPDRPQLKVVVTARARMRPQEGKYLYYHRVQLTKVFDGGPPYPYKGWLPIKNVERYGLASAAEVRRDVETTLTSFFQSLSKIDPATESP